MPFDTTGTAARDVPPGQSWAFTEHRTLAELAPAAPRPARRAPYVCLSDDIAEVAAAEAALRARVAAAEAEIALADELLDAGWYDRADAEFDAADGALALVTRRLDELEEDAGWAELREQRREFWSRVL